MYLPRSLLSQLYNHLLRSHHSLSPPVLILTALEPDALCACRIFTTLLKRDFISHKIQPIAGYGDLTRVGEELIQPMRTSSGGLGGIVVCMGVGGLVDLSEVFGFENEDGSLDMGNVEIWVVDARRPWNLSNVFGGMPGNTMSEESVSSVQNETKGVDRGCITHAYKAGDGGIVVFDDGDIEEELTAEREAFCGLLEMPDLGDGPNSEGDDSDESSSDDNGSHLSDDDDHVSSNLFSKKRKLWTDEQDDLHDRTEPPKRRRRANSDSTDPLASPTPVNNLPSHSSDRSRSVSLATNSPSPETLRVSNMRSMRKKLLRRKRKYESVLRTYYSLGTSYSEPISSILYSLACELGREDNDLLWLAIVGVSSLELSGKTMTGIGISDSSDTGGSAGWGGDRGERIRRVLREEVRRLNPPNTNDLGREALRSEATGIIPTTGRSPNDTSILLSPEPRFLLIRHWSLYDSMLHSPYLAARLHVWSDTGRRRLHKLLAKMGVSLTQCHQNYTHMDMELKRTLRQKLLAYAPLYGLDGLVPPANPNAMSGWGFVRNWGWKACLSATDVGVILGSILEVGSLDPFLAEQDGYPQRGAINEDTSLADSANVVARFWKAYDAIALSSSESPTKLLASLSLAQHLHRAILRTGTSLLSKKQIRHLRSFRIALVKDGPDIKLFANPGALTKLALWIAEAIRVQEEEKGHHYKIAKKRAVGTPFVLASLDEDRNVYVVVGTGGGGGVIDFNRRKEQKRKKQEDREKRRTERETRKAKRAALRAKKFEGHDPTEGEYVEEEDETEEEDDSSDSDGSDSEDDEQENLSRGHFNQNLVRNRFGIAFQEVVQETNARVRIDSFEHCVVEVQKEDLGGFLEALSFRSVVS
ncbi:hypothetical protein KEM54_005844 [Ascosphaera aggregata]|nr:hypothetical protein KEM54_005844 [Ascosphaera aggregata]